TRMGNNTPRSNTPAVRARTSETGVMMCGNIDVVLTVAVNVALGRRGPIALTEEGAVLVLDGSVRIPLDSSDLVECLQRGAEYFGEVEGLACHCERIA